MKIVKARNDAMLRFANRLCNRDNYEWVNYGRLDSTSNIGASIKFEKNFIQMKVSSEKRMDWAAKEGYLDVVTHCDSLSPLNEFLLKTNLFLKSYFLIMEKIHDKKYKISVIDTEQTVKNMISVSEGILPQYIKFTEFDPEHHKIKITLLPDILKEITLNGLVKEVEFIKNAWNIPISDIALAWLTATKTQPVDYDSPVSKALKKIDSVTFWSATTILNEFNRYAMVVADELAKLKKIVKKEATFREKYEKYPPFEITKFIQDSIISERTITIDLDPLEAFDGISLSPTLPFVKLNTGTQAYYKMQKDILPQTEWLDGTATFTIFIRSHDTDSKKEPWDTATIQYTSEVAPFSALLSMSSTSKETERQTIDDITALFSTSTIIFVDRTEKGIKGTFAVPGINIARNVFLDLVTNEELISHYLYVDETGELGTLKTILYLYYSTSTDQDSDDQITAFISERIVSRSDPYFIEKQLDLFTPYINVRVARAKNIIQINRFMKTFSIILNIYKSKFKSIVHDYSGLIPAFKESNVLTATKKVSLSSDKRLRDLQLLDSELFIYDYPRKCEKKFQPIPISKTEIKTWEKKGFQVLNYPTDSANYFVCPDDPLYYPGLIKNKLENKDKYDYLPCCYPVNQMTGKKTLNQYLTGTDEQRRKASVNIVRQKAIDYGKLGYLPRNIYHILKEARPDAEFYRAGVPFGNNSLISAVLLALDDEYLKSEEKEQYSVDFRRNLVGEGKVPVAQQFYDKTEDQLREDILDTDTIFDSKLYTGLIESFLQCQIVMFDGIEDKNGAFEIPRSAQGYLYRKLDPRKRTVLIYKHLGMQSDHLASPHYELVVMKQTPLETTWYFTDKKILTTIFKYFIRCYKIFSIGQARYAPVQIEEILPAVIDATGQVVDSYGKCRGIIVNSIAVYFSPQPPIERVPIVPAPALQSWDVVRKFIAKYKLTIKSQEVFDGTTVGVLVNVEKLAYAYIPFKTTPQMEGISTSQTMAVIIPDAKKNVLEKTVENKKIADFLIQFLFYSFSLWYAEQMKKPENVKEQRVIEGKKLIEQKPMERALLFRLIEEFLETMIVVKESHNYAMAGIPRKLTINNSFFVNGKLVADTEETKRRLSLYIKFTANRNKTLLKNFSSKIYLDNFYKNNSDFHHLDDQIVFIGMQSLTNWLESRGGEKRDIVHTRFRPLEKAPYFFSHWALNGGNPVILQNVKDGRLDRAVAVSAGYNETGLNSGFNTPPQEAIKAHTEYFFKDGLLMKTGTDPVMVWRMAKNFYTAVLIP